MTRASGLVSERAGIAGLEEKSSCKKKDKEEQRNAFGESHTVRAIRVIHDGVLRGLQWRREPIGARGGTGVVDGSPVPEERE